MTGAGTPEDAADRERAAAAEHVREVLLDLGATLEEIDAAEADHTLDLLLVDRTLLPTPARYSQRDIAAASGLELDVLRHLWRALGFLDVDADEPAFTELDLQATRLFGELQASGAADPDSALEMARVIGSSMARIADAEVLPLTLLGPDDGDSVLVADAFARVAVPSVAAVAQLLELVWRRHVQAATRRVLLNRSRDAFVGSSPVVAVGFADLVGFTQLSAHLTDTELGQLVRRFEDISHDLVTGRGGRVVKMIGDEVMYAVEDPVQAVRIGLELSEAYAHDDLLSDVRVGIDRGPVLVREADYFGPTVNRASRIVSIANPGTVLVSDALWSAVSESAPGEIVAKALRPRVLKDIGEEQLWSVRRAGHERHGSRGVGQSRHRGRRWERLGDVLVDLDGLRQRGEQFLAGRRDAPAPPTGDVPAPPTEDAPAPPTEDAPAPPTEDAPPGSGDAGQPEGGDPEGTELEGAVEGLEGRAP